ncbi:hypothetical protein NM688_g3578 [Phlebia brevispora]|uniref:Uncharacterized protein n=1 Tax=Phlebia brevispora TaxID=194682 RepID=A0ACC1T5A4_9APHY|nr:hypothetical protein NM688_g3578 [Phlebia brevispora]
MGCPGQYRRGQPECYYHVGRTIRMDTGDIRDESPRYGVRDCFGAVANRRDDCADAGRLATYDRQRVSGVCQHGNFFSLPGFACCY